MSDLGKTFCVMALILAIVSLPTLFGVSPLAFTVFIVASICHLIIGIILFKTDKGETI